MENNLETGPPPDGYLDLDLDSFAQLDIGKSYYFATNIHDKLKNAFTWFMLAAQQRNMEAQFRVGDMYALGEGIEKNEFTAYDWYIKSAIQGYPKALTRLHNLYHSEKSMYCRGQLNSEEEEWTQDDFKKTNNIRELFEYRVQQLGSQLTRTKEYFVELAATCRDIDDLDENSKKQRYLTLGFLYQHGYGVRKIISRAMEFYQLAAEKRDADAQYNLGYLYQQNFDIKWHYREAFKWCTRAAENGSIGAQRNLAFLYLKGLGTDIDYSKVLYWYARSAESRDIKAQISLACIYRNGEITGQDYEKAVHWYKKAIEEGSKVAQNCLEQLYSAGIPLTESHNHSTKESLTRVYSKKGLCSRLRADISEMTQASELEKLKKRAMCAFKGDANAMLEFGLKYYHGNQFTMDKDIAFRWIRNAAKAGLTDAQFLIAKMFKDGDCVPQNYHTTSAWYKKATKKKDDQAQYYLGMMYYKGLGVRHDYLEASKWFTFAANNNNSDAQLQLGILRKTGRGLRKDLSEAIDLFSTLVKKKNLEAIYQLALMYEGGIGVKPNIELGLFLYEEAARRGNQYSQTKLGNFYSNVNSSMHDIKKSAKYYVMAADQGNAYAKYRLATIHLEGEAVNQNFIQAYSLFKEASMLGESNAANIFEIPINYSKNRDIDYYKLILMFEFVCAKNIDSLEYNLGRLYEQNFTYIHNNLAYIVASDDLSAKRLYKEGAEKNDPESLYDLGMMYEKGEKSAPDLLKAVECYTRAHKNGYTDATYKLAYMHLDGYGVSQNLQTAFYLFTEASEMGHKEAYKTLSIPIENLQEKKFLMIRKMITVMAKSGNVVCQYKLGCSMLYNESTQYCVSEAIIWLDMASKNGYIDASYQLGLLYDKGELVKQDHEIAFQYYQIAADKRNEYALYRLAQLYHFGEGTRQDYAKSFEIYTLAAQEGNQPAQHAIQVKKKINWEDDRNQLTLSTRNRQLDYNSFLQMWEYAAAEGDANLQYELGCMYESEGGYSNLARAFKWYSEAAKNSHGKSIYCLGRMYELGQIVNQDYLKAITFYEESGNLNNEDALYQLGVLYLGGIGVYNDLQQALEYFERAAKVGNSNAMFILGRIFDGKRYLTQDICKALEYLRMSASKDNKEANDYLISVLERIIKQNSYTSYQNNQFLREIYYQLGYLYYYGAGVPIDYGRAWYCFNQANALNKSNGAADYSTIKHEDIHISTKEQYLKKLKMFEDVAEQLTQEQLYELGLIYYHGVFPVSNHVEPECYPEIIKPDYKKAKKYFEMITKQDFPGVRNQYSEVKNHHSETKKDHSEARKHYSEASYCLGMIHYIDNIRGDDSSKPYYYFNNASIMGHQSATTLLDLLNTNDMLVYQKVFEWHVSQPRSRSVAYNIAAMFSKGLGTEIDLKESLKYYKIAADLGHIDALFQLGSIYENDHGVENNYFIAIGYYEKAVDNNHVRASFNLGQMYHYGIGVERDYNHALKLYKFADYHGYSKAQYQLGLFYENGYGTERNCKKALDFFTKAAHQDQAEASFNFKLGQVYFDGKIVDTDYKIALHYYALAAKQGHSGAQLQLCFLHSLGTRLEERYISRLELYTKLAGQNDVGANFNLGQVYFYGIDTDQNITESYWYYIIAADQGYAEAQFKLGAIYEYGRKVEIDYSRAIWWYTQAANQDHIKANFKLGEIYFNGEVGNKDYKKAFKYYKSAADQGHSDSQFQMVYLYSEGLGVKRDVSKATLWYSLFINQNQIEASYQLGQLYFYGKIFSQDYNMALRYFSIAADQDFVDAQLPMAHLYFDGYEVKRDYAKAKALYSKATYKRYIRTKSGVGVMSLNGREDKTTSATSSTIEQHVIQSRCLNTNLKSPPKPYMNLSKLPDERHFKNSNEEESLRSGQLLNAKSIHHLAKEGSMEADFIMAERYLQGQVILQDSEKAFELYTKSALQGYPKALYKIHQLYHKSDKLDRIMNSKHYSNTKKENENKLPKIKQYFSEEFNLYQKADPEDGHSQQQLGFLYQHGFCVKKNTLMAIEYYKKAAAKGLIGAQLNLGYLYQNHEENEFSISAKEVNYREAFRWYEIAAETSNCVAQNCLAYMYLNGFGVKENISKALELYKQSASNGNLDSQITLAKLYRTGKYVTIDLKESVEWYNMATQQDSKIAKNCLYMLKNPIWKDQVGSMENRTFALSQYSTTGLCLKLREDVNGTTFKENYEELKTLARNALVRDGFSMFRVGLNYCDGIDFPKNEDIGSKWIIKAAKTGYPEAQYVLGKKYENMVKDENSDNDSLIRDRHFLNASIWYKKAAKQKHYKAQCSLGFLYENGFGVKEDLELAEHWYTKSAEGNNSDGQYHLGILLFSKINPKNHLKEYASAKDIGRETETKINLNSAISLLTESSDQDHPEANYRMGQLLENGFELPEPENQTEIVICKDPQSAKKYYERAIRIYKERASFSAPSRSIVTTIYTDNLFLTNISLQNNTDQQNGTITVEDHNLNSKCSEPIAQDKLSSICFDKDNRYQLEFSYERSKKKGKIYDQYHPEIMIFSKNRLNVQLAPINQLKDKYMHNCTKADIDNSINFVNILSNKDPSRDDYAISLCKKKGSGIYIQLSKKTVNVLVNQGPENTEKPLEDTSSDLKSWLVTQATTAQLALARIYSDSFSLKNIQLQSNIVQANHELCIEYYTMASDNGDSMAQYEFACLWLEKSKTVNDYKECYQLFQKAADMGNLDAKKLLDIHAKRPTTVNPDKFVEMLLENADTGVSIVEYQLGYCHEYGSNIIGSSSIKQSYTKAIAFYEKAAKAGVTYAQYQLGCVYEEGNGVTCDLKKAFEFHYQASTNGHIDSAYKLANMYYNGEGVEQDMFEAFKLFKKAAKGGNLYAEEALDIDVENNLHDIDNFRKKLKMYEENFYDYYKLGLVYDHKKFPFYDTEEAIRCYSQASKPNIAEAHYRLGLLYEEISQNEKINTESLESSIKHYQKCINATGLANGDAMYRLSVLHLRRPKKKEDYQKVFDWLTSASELGHMQARETLNLSQNIFFNENTTSDDQDLKNYHREIIKMYETVAKQGNTSAQYKLGSVYEDRQNYPKAVQWYSMAVEFDNKGALFRLGKIYQEGNGVPQDIKKSILFYTKAAVHGCEDSLSQLGKILKDKGETKVKLEIKMDHCRKQAFSGNAAAQYILGYLYFVDNPVLDLLKALKWFTRSYLLGNEDASDLLEFNFDEEIDNNQYERKKLAFLEKLIKTNPRFAYYKIAKLYYNETSCLKDFSKAFENYWIAAKEYKNKKAEKYIQLSFNGTSLLAQREEMIRDMFVHVAGQDSKNGEIKPWISEVQYQLGLYYQHAYKQFSERNDYDRKSRYLADATVYFKDAAKHNHVEAKYELAMIYLANRKIDEAKFYLEQARKERHSEVCYQLGKLYIDHDGDFKNGLLYLQESADLGNPSANNDLGLMYKNGAENVPQDYKQAFEAFQRAADKGHPESQFNLALLYQTGQGTKKDEYLSLQWYQKSAKEGNKQAGFQAAMMYMKGEGTSQNKELAQEYLKKYADNDDPEVMYFLSQSNEQKGDTRISILQKSAEKGNHKAQYELGMMHLTGDGVVQNYYKSFTYLDSAAKNGSIEARSPLGWLYENGKGTERNFEAAIDYYKTSDQNCNKEIQYKLGILQKHRAKPNHKKMLLHFNDAVLNGHSDAKYQLGLIYEDGKHLVKDYSAAFKLYRESSEQGNADADYKLGLMYMNGKYVEQDYSKAIQHFEKFEDHSSYRFKYSSGIPDMGLFVNTNSSHALGLYEGDATVENKDSRYKLASIYRNDENGQNNLIISYNLLFQAAKNGHSDAKSELGLIYLKEHNIDEAIRWIGKYGTQGNLGAKNILGCICMKNQALNQKTSEALQYLVYAATQGDVDAQFNLGSIYHYGKKVEVDTGEAIKWYKQSADQGCVASQFALGLIYKNEEDYMEACNYFKKTAEQNHSDSQYFFGWMYENGFGIEKDTVQADKWYEKSKNQESYSCSIFLAELYHYNNDTVTALKWYRKAIDSKYISFAERGMGLIHEYGHLIERDYKKAFQLYMKSAERRNVAAYYDLGRLYYYGRGVEKNIEEAIAWFNKAKSNVRNSVTKHVLANVKGDQVAGTYDEETIEYLIECESYVATKAQGYLDLLSTARLESVPNSFQG